MADPTVFDPVSASPLAGLATPARGIQLAERERLGKINLRGDAGNGEFLRAVRRILGTGLPLEANTTAAGDGVTVFWLGPDEWLIHCAQDQQTELMRRLRTGCGGMHVALTDVSDYYVVMRLSGGKATEVLAKGAPLDVHPGVFTAGRCAQTRYGHASILLHHVDATPTYDVQVRWSFAEYLWIYFVDGAKEYVT